MFERYFPFCYIRTDLGKFLLPHIVSRCPVKENNRQGGSHEWRWLSVQVATIHETSLGVHQEHGAVPGPSAALHTQEVSNSGACEARGD